MPPVTFFRDESQQYVFARFPANQDRDSQWVISFEGFVEELMSDDDDLAQSYLPTTFATALSLGNDHFTVNEEPAILVTASKALNIVIPSSGSRLAIYVDISFEVIQSVQVEHMQHSLSQEDYALKLNLISGVQASLLVNAKDVETTGVLLGFSSENAASAVKQCVLSRIGQKFPSSKRVSEAADVATSESADAVDFIEESGVSEATQPKASSRHTPSISHAKSVGSIPHKGHQVLQRHLGENLRNQFKDAGWPVIAPNGSASQPAADSKTLGPNEKPTKRRLGKEFVDDMLKQDHPKDIAQSTLAKISMTESKDPRVHSSQQESQVVKEPDATIEQGSTDQERWQQGMDAIDSAPEFQAQKIPMCAQTHASDQEANTLKSRSLQIYRPNNGVTTPPQRTILPINIEINSAIDQSNRINLGKIEQDSRAGQRNRNRHEQSIKAPRALMSRQAEKSDHQVSKLSQIQKENRSSQSMKHRQTSVSSQESINKSQKALVTDPQDRNNKNTIDVRQPKSTTHGSAQSQDDSSGQSNATKPKIVPAMNRVSSKKFVKAKVENGAVSHNANLRPSRAGSGSKTSGQRLPIPPADDDIWNEGLAIPVNKNFKPTAKKTRPTKTHAITKVSNSSKLSRNRKSQDKISKAGNLSKGPKSRPAKKANQGAVVSRAQPRRSAAVEANRKLGNQLSSEITPEEHTHDVSSIPNQMMQELPEIPRSPYLQHENDEPPKHRADLLKTALVLGPGGQDMTLQHDGLQKDITTPPDEYAGDQQVHLEDSIVSDSFAHENGAKPSTARIRDPPKPFLPTTALHVHQSPDEMKQSVKDPEVHLDVIRPGNSVVIAAKSMKTQYLQGDQKVRQVNDINEKRGQTPRIPAKPPIAPKAKAADPFATKLTPIISTKAKVSSIRYTRKSGPGDQHTKPANVQVANADGIFEQVIGQYTAGQEQIQPSHRKQTPVPRGMKRKSPDSSTQDHKKKRKESIIRYTAQRDRKSLDDKPGLTPLATSVSKANLIHFDKSGPQNQGKFGQARPTDHDFASISDFDGIVQSEKVPVQQSLALQTAQRITGKSHVSILPSMVNEVRFGIDMQTQRRALEPSKADMQRLPLSEKRNVLQPMPSILEPLGRRSQEKCDSRIESQTHVTEDGSPFLQSQRAFHAAPDADAMTEEEDIENALADAKLEDEHKFTEPIPPAPRLPEPKIVNARLNSLIPRRTENGNVGANRSARSGSHKQLPSSPHAESAVSNSEPFISRPTGVMVNLQTEETVVPSEIQDPFVTNEKVPVSSFISKLNQFAQKVHHEQVAVEDYNNHGQNKGDVIRLPPEDPDKQLVAPATPVQYHRPAESRKDAVEISSGSSSDHSTVKKSASVPSETERPVDPDSSNEWAEDHHYEMYTLLCGIVNRMVKRTIRSEDAIHRKVQDFSDGSKSLIDRLREEHSRHLEINVEIALQTRKKLAAACRKTTSDLEKLSGAKVDVVQRDWSMRQEALTEKLTDALAACQPLA
ncbi:uncharacterized protein KY384_008994 [Bacidia gigantensis]|uniref:uncharacterized protein n=1 Tax=Bacidia gigantensis TaxID=2732470 RepID=UPI001D03C31C|nr:uncharacterized protein KY384_008994 [Bacidia gigantensis]KAG8525350.1 hypothetical protein KY384_008994 [Bacidia gigantensis]